MKRLAASLVATLAAGCANKGGTGGQILFDDFSYATTAELASHGWIMRTAPGWPGVRGSTWAPEGFALHDDPALPRNRVLRMSSVTNGAGANTRQSQLCHHRKYLAGTYAARVRFTDEPAAGPDGDHVVQTFYFISPQKAAMDPDYSEVDFEYLPNGGWGNPETRLRATTWETFQFDPPIDDNVSSKLTGTLAGWHTLVAQIAGEHVRYFVDGRRVAQHGDRFYPEVPMSINFNLWFIEDGLVRSPEMRAYEEHVDWVFFKGGEVLHPEAVEALVAEMRRERVTFRDTVPASGLASPCDF